MTDTITSPATTNATAAPTGGIADQARNVFSGGAGPLLDQAKGFAKARPWASAALAGVVGVALLNTLRGK